MKSRIQKLMAEADVASRRAAEELIEEGRVRVNGALARLGDKADPEIDVIEVDGERLNFAKQQHKVYLALYKPKDVLTTSVVHRGDERLTVLDLVPHKGHLFTIGRLDADSEGLVVLTNDGDLTHKLTHPRYRHTKTYKVTVRGLPNEDTLNRWQEGVWLQDEGKTAPCVVSIVKGTPRETILRITMTEGKKRQIRRVAIALGHPVERLVRTHIGMLSVEGLRPGEWRELTPQDVQALSTSSPALKELSVRKRTQREDQRSQPRGEMRSVDSRPRQRSLIDETTSDERPRRPHYRSDEQVPRSDDRPQRRESGAASYRDQPRRRTASDDTHDDARPRRPRYRPEGDATNNDERAPRRSSSTSSYRDQNRRGSEDDTHVGERPDRPRHSRDGQATRSEDRRPQRRRSSDDTRDDTRRQTDDNSRESNRPKSPRRSSDSRGGGANHSANRPSGMRNRRDDNRSSRKSSDTRRRSSSQGSQRSRRGRDEK